MTASSSSVTTQSCHQDRCVWNKNDVDLNEAAQQDTFIVFPQALVITRNQGSSQPPATTSQRRWIFVLPTKSWCMFCLQSNRPRTKFYPRRNLKSLRVRSYPYYLPDRLGGVQDQLRFAKKVIRLCCFRKDSNHLAPACKITTRPPSVLLPKKSSEGSAMGTSTYAATITISSLYKLDIFPSRNADNPCCRTFKITTWCSYRHCCRACCSAETRGCSTRICRKPTGSSSKLMIDENDGRGSQPRFQVRLLGRQPESPRRHYHD
jgi:hypothetical protein